MSRTARRAAATRPPEAVLDTVRRQSKLAIKVLRRGLAVAGGCPRQGHRAGGLILETRPFDPADYLDSEEAIAAYLADARAGGSAELSEATVVVARARAIMRKQRLSASSPSVRQEAVMAKNTGNDFGAAR